MEKAKELTGLLTDFVNSSNRDKQVEFIEAFCREHRTLQQSAFRLMLALIEHMATSEYRTDGRNEQSHKIAKILVDGFETENIRQQILNGMKKEWAENCKGDDFKPSKYLPYI